MSKKWEIDNIEELSEQEQQEYVEKLKEKYAKQLQGRKNLWNGLAYVGLAGMLAGAFLAGVTGPAYDGIAAATILGSAFGELVVTFGGTASVYDFEDRAKKEIAAVETRIQKNKR